MNNKVIYSCGTCGSKFLNWSSQVGANQYCSKDCYHESLKGREPHNKGKKNHVSKPCKTCGKEIKGEPASVKRRQYCSLSCSGVGNRVSLDRALSRYRIDEGTGCWLWEGSTRGGYGRVRIEGKMMEAHRASYEKYVGDIPDGLVIDHLCRNRSCINPDHMEPVTNAENIKRGNAGKGQRSDAHKQSISNTLKKRFSDPENREKQKQILDKARLSEERLIALRESSKRPDFRARQSERMKAIWAERKKSKNVDS